MKGWELAGGSYIGTDHVKIPKPNQDSFLLHPDPWSFFDDEGKFHRDSWIGAVEKSPFLNTVVCDGCGSGRFSHFGSAMGARIINHGIEIFLQDLLDGDDWFWERVRQHLLLEMRILARKLGGSFSRNVSEYFLFTVVGSLIVGDWLYVYSIGDGVYCLNGEMTALGPFPGNKPPYVAYELTGVTFNVVDPNFFKFKVTKVPLAEVSSVLVGSDGVSEYLAKVADRKIPGKSVLVGPLSQFWENDLYFGNIEGTNRRLKLVGRTVVRPEVDRTDPTRAVLREQPGLLKDDTTLCVMRRKKETEGE